MFNQYLFAPAPQMSAFESVLVPMILGVELPNAKFIWPLCCRRFVSIRSSRSWQIKKKLFSDCWKRHSKFYSKKWFTNKSSKKYYTEVLSRFFFLKCTWLDLSIRPNPDGPINRKLDSQIYGPRAETGWPKNELV